MAKIIFIINIILNQRCIKRINEFIENGYDISAYSFVREGVSYKQLCNFNIQIIGMLKKTGGYLGRIIDLY